MQISTRESDEVLVVDISGRLDSTTSGHGYDELGRMVQGGNKKIVVNLEKLEYVSSSGLQILLTATKLAKDLGGQIKFCNPTDLVNHTLTVSGFNILLSVYDSEDDAIKAF